MRNRFLWWGIFVMVLGGAAILPAMLTCRAAAEKGEAMTQQVQILPTRYRQMYEVYEQNKRQGRATLITSDSVLHTAHVLFDYTLRAAELQSFTQSLQQLTSLMLDRLAPQAERGNAASPYTRTAVYFGVAQKLLDPQAAIPEAIRPQVEREVALIMAHNAVALSPTLGVQEDYTQYTPRGHYTRNAQFQQLFRALMWYGRAGFPIAGEKSPGVRLTPEEARANALAGILLSRTLDTLVVAQVDTRAGGHPVTAMSLWQGIYQPTAFLVGPADDLTPPEYVALSTKIFGDQMPQADETTQLDRFIADAIKLRPPQIIGTAQFGAQPQVALRLLGQRLVPDSLIFQQLTNPNVPGRNMPSGLDVMAVLGSSTAEAQLRQRGEFHNPAYAEQMKKLRDEFAGFTDTDWSKTAYLLWLHMLQPLVADDAPGTIRAPWWNDPTWKLKQLNAGLGSWAELRHDTILYAKQSYAALAVRPMPNPGTPVIYVEPVPQVYDGIIRLLTTTRDRLTDQGVFPRELEPNYRDFLALLNSLLRISRQEAGGKTTATPTESGDYDDLHQANEIGSILKRVEMLPAPLREQLTGDEDAQIPLIADVHTDPNSGQVLEVGIGQVQAIVVPVSFAQTGTVDAYGPIFTYYEFPQPLSHRLTDAEWQQRLLGDRELKPYVLPEEK